MQPLWEYCSISGCMRLCVSCGKNNNKRKFIGVQCEECFRDNPVVDVEVMVEDLDNTIYKDRVMAFEDIKDVMIREGVKRDKIKGEAKKEVVLKKDKVCVHCGEIDLKGEKHKDCLRRRKCDRQRSYYHKNKELKGGRVGKRLEERLAELPERKVCDGCGEEKRIGDYYLRGNGYIYGNCKVCHRKRCVEVNNRDWEGYLRYHRDYYKNRGGLSARVKSVEERLFKIKK